MVVVGETVSPRDQQQGFCGCVVLWIFWFFVVASWTYPGKNCLCIPNAKIQEAWHSTSSSRIFQRDLGVFRRATMRKPTHDNITQSIRQDSPGGDTCFVPYGTHTRMKHVVRPSLFYFCCCRVTHTHTHTHTLCEWLVCQVTRYRYGRRHLVSLSTKTNERLDSSSQVWIQIRLTVPNRPEVVVVLLVEPWWPVPTVPPLNHHNHNNHHHRIIPTCY